MASEPQPPRASADPYRMLSALAVALACLCSLIAVLSWHFDYYSAVTDRPIVAVLLLFALAFATYFIAIRQAARASQDGRLLRLIVGSAIVFRVILLFSVPIQEIDIYRYLWDGAVSSVGISPFQFSPDQVLAAAENGTSDGDLQRLVKLQRDDPVLAEVLQRVHFGQLPTVYPPTSQIVFAAASSVTPSGASVIARIFVMKAWLIGLDIATLLVVVQLLRFCRKPVGYCIVYAWCPLILKEIANSGHLDSIAVFLTSLAFCTTAWVIQRTGRMSSARESGLATLSATVLGLAVGAKLYPIVLTPLLVLALASRIGWRRALVPVAVLAITTYVVCYPMLPWSTSPSSTSQADTMMLEESEDVAVGDPSLGVKTFLQCWEMNDFIFLILIENLKPDPSASSEAWFAILPEPQREQIVSAVVSRFELHPEATPFMIVRVLTAAVFLLLAALFAWNGGRDATASSLCRAAFLTLAWFWLLCPTQNPWYWIWAMPFLPFARSKAWLAVSALVMLYYLRFWLMYHWPEESVAGTPYVGYLFFDFVVTWIEFGPWFVWLLVDYWLYRRRSKSQHSPMSA